MKNKIFQIFSEVFDISVDEVNENLSQQNFESWDSIMHLNLIAELESQLDVVFEPEEIEKADYLGKIVSLLMNKLNAGN